MKHEEALSLKFFDDIRAWLDANKCEGMRFDDRIVCVINHRQWTFFTRGIVATKRKAISRRRKRNMRKAYR